MPSEPPEPAASPASPAALTRRDFVAQSAMAAAAWMIVPRHVLGQGLTPPSDLVNIAVVGIGGMGAVNAQAVMSQNIVAICDVDDALLEARLTHGNGHSSRRRRCSRQPAALAATAAGASAGAPAGNAGVGRARTVESAGAADEKWRPAQDRVVLQRFVEEQLPRLKTPPRLSRDARAAERHRRGHHRDARSHARADRVGGDGRRQARLRAEADVLVGARSAASREQAAANPKLVTQMGNQGHSLDEARRGQDYLASGMIGDITDVHVWTNRPLGYWPQGVPRPKKFDGDWKSSAGTIAASPTPRARVHEQGEGQRAERAPLGSVPRRRA